jgi:N-acetylglucosaminyl-diphospho-decaprenol L-rhamnosyltransferase
MSSVDVVVVAYNSRDTLRECVGSLCRAEGVEVIVVDNASPDDSLSAVRDLPVDAVALDTNLGFSHGCNTGWRRGSGDYVLFLNPDARLDPSSLRRLAQVLDESPGVGVVGPRIVDEDGALDYSIRRFPRLASTYAQALFLHRLWPRADWSDEVVWVRARYEAAGPAEWLSGACLLVRRSFLESTGGFDEGFFMYCEDKDLCRRAWDAGLEVRFEPDAVALHLGGGGSSGPRAELLPVLATSRVRYAQKHSGRWSALAERLGVALGSLTHAVLGRRGDARRGHARALVSALTDT